MEEMIKKLQSDHVDEFEVYLADYSTDTGRAIAIEELDRIFMESTRPMRVDSGNLQMVLSQTAPIITADNKIISIGIVPSANRLVQAVHTGEALLPGTSCC